LALKEEEALKKRSSSSRFRACEGFLRKLWFEEDEQKAREAALLRRVVKPSEFFVLHVESNNPFVLFKPRYADAWRRQ
jgi:hypothetical protein